MQEFTLPIWVVILHLINLFCLLLLIRSGIQILYDHPKLYWTDNTTDDNHWLRFGKKIMPKDKLWTSLDEAEDPGKLALPGGTHNLGSARHWHFTIAIIWVLSGLLYLGFLFATGSWHRIIPTDIGIFSQAVDVVSTYLTFHLPTESTTGGYNAMQQLTYFFVIFILAPIMIITGLALSPAVVARFPGFLKLFGGRRQVARSIHFIGMAIFCLYILIHVTLTLGFHFYDSVKLVTFGNVDVNFWEAFTLFLVACVLLLAFNIWASIFTLNDQVRLRRILTKFYVPVVRVLFGWMKSRQYYTKKDISPFFRVNGYPPNTTEYDKLKSNDFQDWKLKVYGLVDNPLEMSLQEIKGLKHINQITKHNCIQGWTAVAEWGGLPMSDVMKLCKPKSTAKFVLFHCFDVDDNGQSFYSGLRIEDMYDKQTILAYEMNGETLPIQYGAPLRLRCEKKYGYKMAKYLKSIEFVDDFKAIGQGRGGYREDTVFFDWEAAI
jgi:DMSO/TMAO reductase YedYZ molybdopterin-dependent catalytic subunit/thiosulfate reductase cytochrome b subunit